MGSLNPILASAEKPRLDSQKHKIGRSPTKPGADSKQNRFTLSQKLRIRFVQLLS
ncbi:hypothetical protein RchiOBHm_Chr2g0130211 [Rosa chinensis]|uniref:Uncharacterized protein n=1 Tax=Rosa chinensis TaxID=74649 RepID=A0A2P6RUS0_ROSCH|nr:hypothetical protein RchiOBHm_Chr2g0130211 [Rosa chinensis]